MCVQRKTPSSKPATASSPNVQVIELDWIVKFSTKTFKDLYSDAAYEKAFFVIPNNVRRKCEQSASDSFLTYCSYFMLNTALIDICPVQMIAALFYKFQ